MYIYRILIYWGCQDFLPTGKWDQNKLRHRCFSGSMLIRFSSQHRSVSTLPSQCGNPICDNICFKFNLLLFSPCSWSHSSDEMRLCLATSVLVLLSPSCLRSCCAEMVDELDISISVLGSKSQRPPVKAIVKLRLPENLEIIYYQQKIGLK